MITSNRGGRLAPLLIGITMRQATSRTAQVQAGLPPLQGPPGVPSNTGGESAKRFQL